jgi:hypothetical protein
MNLIDLEALNESATQAPWSNLPLLVTAGGMPYLSSPNAKLLVSLRNVAGETLAVLRAMNGVAIAWNALSKTFTPEGLSTEATPAAQRALQDAIVAALVANDQVHKVMGRRA